MIGQSGESSPILEHFKWVMGARLLGVMMDVLPNVLVKAQEQLCEEDILSSWNIGSYNNMTTVSKMFMKPGHIGSPPVIGMRRKSQ